jgi:hypothetical protein
MVPDVDVNVPIVAIVMLAFETNKDVIVPAVFNKFPIVPIDAFIVLEYKAPEIPRPPVIIRAPVIVLVDAVPVPILTLTPS